MRYPGRLMSTPIPQAAIQEILERVDLVEIIQARLSLTKHGKNFFGACPFHDEKSPSFCVNQEKQFYYCFGCKASGNAIHFLVQYDKIEFIDAVNYLANRAGIDLSQYDGQSTLSSYSALYQLLEITTKSYQKALRNSQAAIQYLKNRGLDGQTAKEFRLGYAPESWNFLTEQLHPNTETLQHLLTTGMITQSNKRSYDRFRNRIMFPIRNLRGQIVGYGGRTIKNEQPKYLNSPETPLFHKSDLLYGLYEAKQKNRHLEKIVVVEGYMDVIGLAQHGIHYAAATLGTAINRKHLQLLLRHCSYIIFCFDGDIAGNQAAWQALKLAMPFLQEGVHIRFQFLPNQEDPDSFVQKIGKDQFEKFLEEATPLEDVLFEKLKKEHPIHSLENKAHFAKNALELIQMMPKGIYQSLLNEKLSQLLEIRLTELEISNHQTQPSPKMPPTKITTPSPVYTKKVSKKQLSPWQIITSLLLKDATLIKLVPVTENFNNDILHYPILKKLIDVLKENVKTPLSTGSLLSVFESPEDQQLLAALASRPLSIPKEGMAVELLGAIQRIREQNHNQLAQSLIEKAKKSALNDEEKKLLQSLWASKKPKD